MCCRAGCLQVSARRHHLTAPARSLSGIATSSGSISVSGARTDAALRTSAAASGMRLAVGVGAMALEALTAFRLHRLYTDGVVLSKSSAAVRGFAFRWSQVGALARCACREARCRVAELVFKGCAHIGMSLGVCCLQVAVTLLDAANGTVAAGSTTATDSGDWQIALADLKPGAAMHARINRLETRSSCSDRVAVAGW